MSLLPAEINAELAQLLQALQSADNNVRSQAEEHLQNNWTNTRPEVLLMGLVEQISGSTDGSVSNNTPAHDQTPSLPWLFLYLISPPHLAPPHTHLSPPGCMHDADQGRIS